MTSFYLFMQNIYTKRKVAITAYKELAKVQFVNVAKPVSVSKSVSTSNTAFPSKLAMLQTKGAPVLLYPEQQHSNTEGVLLAKSPGENRGEKSLKYN